MAATVSIRLRHIRNQLRQSMRIYFKNNHAKFHPDLISNNWALSFLKRSLPQEENKMSSDMGSVPGPRKKKTK